MNMKSNSISRRTVLQIGSLFLVNSLWKGCAGIVDRPSQFKPVVNRKAHWTRRNEWTGDEYVLGVCQIENRFLMIQKNDGWGWTFPWGKVEPGKYGYKNEKNEDLIKAANFIVHDQTYIPIVGGDGVVLAYGYAIDNVRDKVYLAHWVQVAPLSDFPTHPQPNLRDVFEARWASPEDPMLGNCLARRLKEINDAGEGKTLILEPCAER